MTDTDQGTVRPFADWLAEQRNGVAATELAEALHDLIAAVGEHVKAGKLVLTIDVAPATKGDASILAVTDTITVKAPKGERGASLFFTTDGGNLSRQDPRQQRMPLRTVPDHDEKLKEA